MFSKAVFKSAALPVFVIFAVAVVPPIIGDQSPIVNVPAGVKIAAAVNVAAGVNVPAGDGALPTQPGYVPVPVQLLIHPLPLTAPLEQVATLLTHPF